MEDEVRSIPIISSS